MSCIIRIQPNKQGLYPFEQQSHRIYPENWNGDGWLPVPTDLERKVAQLAPYAKPVIQDNVIIDVEEVEHSEPELPAPTAAEQLRADVDFIAAMTGVDLV